MKEEGQAREAARIHLSVNNYLEQVRLAIGNCYQNLQLKGRIITAEMVKE